MIARKTAINFRDELIAAKLTKLNVDFLIDIGCDFGSLLASATKRGIKAIGLDIDKTSLKLAKSASLEVRNYSIQSICESNTLANFIPSKAKVKSVSCLNMIHSKNFDKRLKYKLIKIMVSEFEYVVLSCDKRLLNKLKRTHNLEIVSFISQVNKPIGTLRAILQQYGTSFLFKNVYLHNLEQKFWGILFGKFTYINPVAPYTQLCVVVKAKKNYKNLST